MKGTERLELNAMPEHRALHVADQMLEEICRMCIGLVELYALNPLQLDPDTSEIVAIAGRMHAKVKAAHERLLHGPVH